jgi:hypothetical protein
MSALRQALTDYLAMRRALGYKLDKTERLLGQFVSFVENRGEKCLTTETALAWANLPAGADASWTSRRLAEVRIFARHLHGLDPATQVPPMGTRRFGIQSMLLPSSAFLPFRQSASIDGS